MANTIIEKKVSGSKIDRIKTLRFVSPNVDSQLTSQENAYNSFLWITDKNERELGGLYGMCLENSTGIQMEAGRYINNVRYMNALRLTIDNDGNPKIYLAKAAWKTALGYLSNNGDTGNGSYLFKTTAVDTTASSRTSNQYQYLGLIDTGNRYYAYLQGVQRTNGDVELTLIARNIVNNANQDAVLRIHSNKNGVRRITSNSDIYLDYGARYATQLNYNTNTNQGANTWWGSDGFYSYDNEGYARWYLRSVVSYGGNNSQGVQLEVNRYVGTGADRTRYTNSLYMGINTDGTPHVEFTFANKWRIGLGANSSGYWPVSLGGTGANTAAGALANLSAAKEILIKLVKGTTINNVKSNTDFGTTHNIALSGYTPIGIVGYYLEGSNNTWCFPFRMYITGNLVALGLRIPESGVTGVNITPNFYVLYQKNVS